uniref:VIRB2 type IV secretion fmaily protein n=1 Tax=Sphingomonas sp. JE1 TaxID=1628059 RepID=A0A0D4ZZR4_9SPHN|nr:MULTISPECIES: TrbC/VirB2 family protein [unclassified Sphingomonas]AJW29614.1 VIRB2 type IV secretion fmaily protein [Sphingomonas sp. JE1]
MKINAILRVPVWPIRSTVQRHMAGMSPLQRKTTSFAAMAAIVGIATLLSPDPAFAQSANLEGFANNVLALLSNGLLRALAVIAVIIAGAGWLMGRVNTGGLVTVIIGIAIIFSAPWIVDQIAGSA